MVKLRELKLKGETICDCGHIFIANDITNLIKNEDYQFYGGRVAYYSETICPNCKKAIVIMLEPYNNSYRVIDIAENEQENVQKDTEISVENTQCNAENKQVSEQENKQEKGNKEEEYSLICDKCNKEFKSKSGLIIHKKTCKG